MKPNFTYLCLYLLLIFFVSHSAYAINETEPNNTAVTANFIPQDSLMNGTIGASGDNNDYFKGLPSQEGTVRIILRYENLAATVGPDIFLYVYNKNLAGIGNRLINNPALGVTSDTLFIPCRQADTIVFYLNSSGGAFNYTLSYSTIPTGVNDAEPNNTFATANSVIHTDTIKGRIGYTGVTTDGADYYKAALPDGGNVKVVFRYNNTSGSTTSDFLLYTYNKNQVGIGTKFNYNVALGWSPWDTLVLNCRERDSVFFYITSSGCFAYELFYIIENIGPNDVEPNNSFAQAISVTHTDTVRGRIGLVGTITDNADYYKAALPDGGRVKVVFRYNNTSGSTTSDFLLYAYNKNQVGIGTKFNYNVALGWSPWDTLVLNCRERDSVFFYITSSGCFAYELFYIIENIGPNDVEPNNTFAQATSVTHTDTIRGRIGLVGTTTDNADYYKAALPDGGRIKVIFRYNNTSGSTTSDFFLYTYNKNQAGIGNKFNYDVPLGWSAWDTLTLNCRARDSIFFYITSSGCFAYELFYIIENIGPNDVEPNNTFAQAISVTHTDTIRGRIGLVGTTTDNADYYKAALPDGGRVNVIFRYNNTSGGTGSDFLLYAYNKNQAGIGTKFNYNVALGWSVWDTLVLDCRDRDSIFFYITSTGCFAYELLYIVDNIGPNDVEPNNTFAQATSVTHTDTIRGRIGLVGTVTDGADYYKLALPDAGTVRVIYRYNNVSNSTSSDFFLYSYNKNQAGIGTRFNYNVALGWSAWDTLLINCRDQDSIYLYINSSGCLSYEITYQVETPGPNDLEPNNTFAQATTFNHTDTIRGRIGFVGTTTDGADYYKTMLPAGGKLKLYFRYNKVSTTGNANFFVYAYNINRVGIGTKFNYTVPFGWSTWDTLTINCRPLDSVYFYINSSGCFAYELFYEVEDGIPSADIGFSRMGNKFAFIANTKDRTHTNTWNFGDGTTSTLRLPIKEFSIGSYDVVLESRNTVCNLVARDTFPIVIEGIEDYLPKSAGVAGGIGYLNMRIFGGGLDTNAVVRLRRGGTVIEPVRLGSPTRAQLNVMFDLKNVAVGKYNLEITLSGGFQKTFVEGVDIFEDKPGFDIKAVLTGPSTVRTNVWNNFRLTVSNDRARLANSVVVCIVVPSGVETNLKDVVEKRTGKLNIKGPVYDELTIPFPQFNNTYFNNTFNPNLDTIEIDYDDLYQHLDSVLAVPIDTLFEIPYVGKVYHFLIPMIDGNSSRTISFRVRSTNNGNKKMYAYAWPFNLRQNPLSGEALDVIHDAGMQAAALAELAPNPALRAVGKYAGYLDIASKIAFTEYYDWKYGGNNADEAFYAKQTLAFGMEKAGGLSTHGTKYRAGKDKAEYVKNNLKDGTQKIRQTEDILKDWGVVDASMANRLKKDLDDYNKVLAAAGNSLTPAQKQDRLNALKHMLAKSGLFLTNQQLEKFIFDSENPTNRPKRLNPRDMNSLNSFDPNEIYGPQGFGEKRYLEDAATMNYIVTFENVDTALAPAQIVRVELQLDTNKFDIKNTTLGDVTLGDSTYFLVADRKSYFRDIDLRPAKNMLVRVNATIDTLTGKLEWIFTSLDPATNDFITDVFDGFLPPNVNAPEGEGSVSFQTQMKAGLPNNDSLACFAEIYFDGNEPILTSNWRNSVDKAIPTASLSPIIRIEEANQMIVSINGSDAESGLESYLLYFKLNDGPWSQGGIPLPPNNEASIVGTPGNTYSFYIEARDSVGNQLTRTPISEASIFLPFTESDIDPDFMLYPNPNNGIFSIRSNGNFEKVNVSVIDIFGKIAFMSEKSFFIDTDTGFETAGLAQGTYLVRFTLANGKVQTKKLVVINPN